MYNVGYQIKFKGPSECFRHGPLYMVYVIQISSYGRTWVKSIGHHQVIGQMSSFIYLFTCLLTYLLTYLLEYY